MVKGEDGLLHFLGRDDAMIKASGNRVSPTEIEEAAMASGVVSEAVALGVPDERLGQAIVLVAVAKGEDAEERLRAYLRRELPPHMQPQRIVWRDELPVDPNGKLDRAALEERARMKALGPIPPASRPTRDGMLLIGGRDAEALVGEAGDTPLFVYDSAGSPRQVARFRAAFPSDVALHYAVKANPYAPLLEAMCKHGRRLRRRLGRRAGPGRAPRPADQLRRARQARRRSWRPRSAPASPSTSKPKARPSGRWRSARGTG